MANEAKQFTIGGVTHDVMDVGARQLIAQLQAAIDAITSGDTTTAIKTFQEVINFLDGVTDDATLIGKLNELRTLIAAKYTKPSSGIPASDLADGVIPDVSGFATKTEVNSKANSADVVPKSRTVNGKELSSDVTIGMSDIQGLVDAINNVGSGAVSVTTNQDGTFTIHVGETDYTINLNHTHEGMAKLVKCTEATLPQTLADDTIYVQVDNLTTPSEIEALHIFGLEFTGGGGAAPGAPYLSSPDANISMGDSENGSVTKAIRVKGRYLTQALSVALTGTGYTFGSTQPTGVMRNSDTSLTITADAAKAGVDISVVYTGASFNAAGTLGIISGSPDNIDVESTLLANELDTDGLIGLWDGGDAVQNNAWVDKINGMKLNLVGAAEKTNDGYHLNNLSSCVNAKMPLDSSAFTLLNSEIAKEFTCVVECLVKFSSAEMSALIIDFGGLGTSLSNISLNCTVKQIGLLSHTAKQDGNNIVTAYENNKNIGVFPLDTYVPVRMICGVKLSADGTTQICYAQVGDMQVSTRISTPSVINLNGCTGYNYPFGCGIIYQGQYADRDLPSYRYDVIYKSILLYNKDKES